MQAAKCLHADMFLCSGSDAHLNSETQGPFRFGTWLENGNGLQATCPTLHEAKLRTLRAWSKETFIDGEVASRPCCSLN